MGGRIWVRKDIIGDGGEMGSKVGYHKVVGGYKLSKKE